MLLAGQELPNLLVYHNISTLCYLVAQERKKACVLLFGFKQKRIRLLNFLPIKVYFNVNI